LNRNFLASSYPKSSLRFAYLDLCFSFRVGRSMLDVRCSIFNESNNIRGNI
jgi:hypothetical protein